MTDASRPGNRSEALARAAAAAGSVFAAFTAVMALLTAVSFYRLQTEDPLNDPRIVRLRQQYSTKQTDVKLKESIRSLDNELRKTYFRTKARIRRGGLLVMAGAALSLAALGLARSARKAPPPRPALPTDDARFWSAIARARVGVAAAVLIAILAVLLLVRLWR